MTTGEPPPELFDARFMQEWAAREADVRDILAAQWAEWVHGEWRGADVRPETVDAANASVVTALSRSLALAITLNIFNRRYRPVRPRSTARVTKSRAAKDPAATLHGGVYTIVVAGAGGSEGDIVAYRLNRFTGSIAYCRYLQCGRVPIQ